MPSVLSVAYRLAPVRTDSVGGAEQVLGVLDRALVAAGQRSMVLACEGSTTAGLLAAVRIGLGPLSDARRERTAQRFGQRLNQLLREHDFDVIHFHGMDVASYPLGEPWLRDVPKLVTLHLPLECYPPELFRIGGALAFNTVSEWQHERVGGRVDVRTMIPNGVDLSEWRPTAEPEGRYVACLGRICHEKGYDVALRAAHAAGVPLVLGGQVFGYAEHQRHFTEQIAPLLDGERRFVGPVSGEAKRRLLANASAVLVPSRIAETCSLVTLEALACGTPVITSAAGAPSSLIEAGISGWVAKDEADFARALARVHELSRSACRLRAERFDQRETARRYLALYAEIAGGARRPQRSHALGAP
jgi:glycosyltransferase involved in cell wall biosynthesis